MTCSAVRQFLIATANPHLLGFVFYFYLFIFLFYLFLFFLLFTEVLWKYVSSYHRFSLHIHYTLLFDFRCNSLQSQLLKIPLSKPHMSS